MKSALQIKSDRRFHHQQQQPTMCNKEKPPRAFEKMEPAIVLRLCFKKQKGVMIIQLPK